MEPYVESNPQVLDRQPNKKIFFTVKTNYVGFTDQLCHFKAYYKLGAYFGFKYLHTPFCSDRSSKAIYKFIGFNRHFNANGHFFCNSLASKVLTLLRICKYKTIYHHFTNRIVSEANLNSFEDLLNHIRTVSSCNSRRPLLIIFSGKSRIYELIHSNIGNPEPPVDLRSSYFTSRALDPWPSRFQSNSIKILIHIRQGDTALIPTPWNTLIHTRKSCEIKAADLSGIRYTDDDDYFRFLKLLINELGPYKFSVVICSDGYKRGFRKIYRLKRRLGFSADQLKQLKRLDNDFEEEKFRQFASIPNCVSVIGESDTNLFDLIHSAMLADLIVVGDQQDMMCKFMASYSDQLNPPMYVHLHNREQVKKYCLELGMNDTNIKTTSINMRNKSDDLIKQIGKDLIEQWKQSQ